MFRDKDDKILEKRGFLLRANIHDFKSSLKEITSYIGPEYKCPVHLGMKRNREIRIVHINQCEDTDSGKLGPAVVSIFKGDSDTAFKKF